MSAESNNTISDGQRKSGMKALRLRSAQIQQLYSQMRPEMYGTLAGALILTFVLWNVASHWMLIAWLTSFVAVQVPRHALVSAFLRIRPVGEATIPWGRWLAVGSAATGAMCSIGCIILFPSGSLIHQFVMALFLVGFACLIAVAHAPLKMSYLPSILLAMVPSSGRAICEGGQENTVIGIAALAWTAVFVGLAGRMNAANADSLNLRFENDDLIDHLKAEVSQRERAEEDLQKARGELELQVDRLVDANEQLRQEIADRRLVQQALRESEDLLRSILTTSPVGISLTKNRKIHWVNDAWAKLFGFEHDHQYLGKHTRQLYASDEEYERVGRVLYPDLKSGNVTETAASFRRADGSAFDAHVRMKAIDPLDPSKGTIAAVSDISDQKRAERALRDSEEKYRLVVETAQEGIFVGQDGMLRFVNRFVEQVTGYSREELLSMPFAELIAADYRDLVLDYHFRRLAGEKFPTRYSAKIVDKQGRPKWVEMDSVMITWEGRPAVLAFATDITERKQAEEALRQSEERYRTLVEESFDGIFVQRGPKIVFANQRLCQLLRYDQGELEGLDHWLVYHPDYQEITRSRARARMAGESVPAQYEVRLQRKDGSSFDGEIRARAIVIEGEPGVQVWVRDITESKMAREALKESEQKYRSVVDNANEAIFVAQDGMLKFVNPKCSELIGYSEDELTSTPFLDFIHPDDRGMVVERYQKRLRRERFIDVYPFRIIDKWGKTRWVEINVVFVNWAGRPATLNFLTDITSRRAMEEELLKVQKLESIGVLAGGIAHDFNNILTAILGNISLAKIYSEGGDRAGERLTEAEKACLQAQALTQQLLTFSKGGAPVKKVLSVSQLVSDSSLFALRGSNVRSEMSVPDDLWTVEADEGQIGQVIGNLVINADEAMPLGGVIHVQAENVTMTASDGLPIRDGKYVRVSVTDYGVGIPQEILPRIFDPYFTTKQKGSGLGLTTAYSIVKNHDGLITVESRPGVATTFHVYLPASEKEEEPRQDSEEQLIRGKGRILLMDDEETIRDLAAEMLSLMGYEVVLAEHGAEAIDLYKSARISSRPFDAIIMDLTVRGGMGGREAIEILSKIDPNIKAIVSSGYSSDPIMADYGKYGFSGVAAKPYTASELGEILSKVLKQRES